MARKPRFTLPGIPQHVIQRGNNRELCFFDKADTRRYLDILQEVAILNLCYVHAYVLMTNHRLVPAYRVARTLKNSQCLTILINILDVY